jgi:membrane associated rhomboid family serine protease
LFTSAFLHTGFFHIFGNMVFLWIFGRHFDDLMEWCIYLAVVVICILSSALVQVMAQPTSTIPTIGASGFVAGLMGAYLVLFPKRNFTNTGAYHS